MANTAHSGWIWRTGLALVLLLALAIATAQTQAPKFKVLHTFHGRDGGGPEGVLMLDAVGNIYGTAEGGTKCGKLSGCGTAFKLNKAGRQVWLYSFGGGNGRWPAAGLLREAAGNLFGTTVRGGDVNCVPPEGCGVVFKLSKTGKEETVLYQFKGSPDGADPESLLVEDKAGNLYGTTEYGGTGNNGGTIFKVDKEGQETVLYSFCSQTRCSDGQYPDPGVIRDAAGNLYGVAGSGGGSDKGVVYELDAAGSETILHNFEGGADGAQPVSVLLLDSQGNLYGTTENGGNGQCGGTGCGTVFKLSPQSGGGWTEKVLYAFCSLSDCTDGEEPGTGPLVRDSAGNLYGTTIYGGTSRNCAGSGCGAVFKLEPNGEETVLHSFTGGSDGAYPIAGLTVDSRGSLYGTTESGGATCHPSYTCGVVFEITP